jgi:hypothetical protein
MFIGQPRSGTTLIGSLLNAHRNMLVAQELNALKYVRRGYDRDQLFWLIHQNEKEFGAHGRRWTGYQYNVPSQWQGKWEKLLVIGDKKAGKSSEELARRSQLLERLERIVQLPVKVVHIVRNPFNVITTIHRKVPNTSLPEAAGMYFARCAVNWRLMQERPDQVFTFRLEQFIGDPGRHLRSLCDWLNLPAHDDYLNDCQRLVFAQPHQSRFDVDWPAELVKSVQERMCLYPFLGGYKFHEVGGSSKAA